MSHDSTRAQSKKGDRIWTNLGVGGSLGMLNFHAGLYMNGKSGMLGLCYTTASSFGSLSNIDPFSNGVRYSNEAHQFGPVYGIVSTGSTGHVSIAAGPTFSYGQREKVRQQGDQSFYYAEKFRTVALTFDAQAYLHVARTSGIGLTYTQTISHKRTWGTLNAAITIGIINGGY
jgi:hypothetical protein